MDKLKLDKNNNLPIILFVVFLVCTFLCILSFNISALAALDNSKMLNANCICKNKKCVCNVKYRDSTYDNYEDYEYMDNVEHFENSKIEDSTNIYSEQLSFRKLKKLSLLPQEQPNVITNMLISGHANLFIFDNTIRLDLVCSLYDIGANVYGQLHPDDRYEAYLYNEQSNKTLPLGILKRQGDGFYKLSYSSNNAQDVLDYKEIRVAYVTKGKSTDLITATL